MANAPGRNVGNPTANGRGNGSMSRAQSAPVGTPPPVANHIEHLPSDHDREARRRRVAEAAYYRAERRGFAPGGEVDDWLEAEKEVESGNEKKGDTKST